MKKILLASAALVAFAGVAQAAEPVKLTVGGYANEYVGYADNKAALGKVKLDTQDDVNINFMGSTKLDNGISVAVQVETFGSQRQDSRNGNVNCGKTASGTSPLYASSTNPSVCSNSNVKRAYTAISGGFGAVIIGEREDVGYIVHNSAPSVGAVGLQDGAWFQYVVSPSQHRAYTATNPSRYDNRVNKFTYVTPAFAGLAAGFTYVPNISQSQSGHTAMTSSADTANYAGTGYVNGTDFGGDLYVGGLAYSNKFGDVSVAADAGVGQASIANLRVYQGGLKVSYAGFTVGGSILNRNVPDSAHLIVAASSSGMLGSTPAGQLANNLTKTAAYAGQSWDLGVSYATGPVAVSLGYFYDRSKSASALNGTGKADSTAVYELGAAYTMGPGVSLVGSLGYVDYKGDVASSSSAANIAKNNNKGVLAVTGLKVAF